MKFICSQKSFLEALVTVQKAVPAKTTKQILEGIYIKVYNDKLQLVATDLNLGIESFIEANIIEEGDIIIPSRILVELVRKLPDAPIEFQLSDNNIVKLSCLNSIVTIQGLEAAEFPELPTVEKSDSIEVDQQLFNDMIRQTIFAVAVDETRPILTGALIEVEGNEINIVCIDGYRVAVRKGRVENHHEFKKVIIPGKSLNEVSKIFTEENQKVKIIISDKHVLFDMGNTRITSRVLEGDYLNYNQIIPSDYKSRVKVDAKILSDSIERASLIAREGKNNLIKLNIDDQKMVITSNSEAGQVYEEIPVLLEGKEIEVAFNARYFMDILKAVHDPEVCLDFTTNVSPCVIRPIEGNDYTYLLLPVRIYI